MDCAPYCHPTVSSNQGFFINFGILGVSSEAGRLESCGVGWTIGIENRKRGCVFSNVRSVAFRYVELKSGERPPALGKISRETRDAQIRDDRELLP